MSDRGAAKARPLSDLVLDGVGNATLHFGPSGTVTSGGQLLTYGRTAFSVSADTDTFAMLMTNDPPTVAVLLAALEVGARIVSLPLPSRNADPGAYLDFVRASCDTQRVDFLVASDDIAELLSPTGIVIRKHSELELGPVAGPSRNGFELVQFSSGSTAQPKGVQLHDLALGANVESIMETLEPSPGDHAVSWLPLSHDMGLIGMLLTGIASASSRFAGRGDIALLDPGDFLREPRAWLGVLSELHATITAAPDFGYRAVTRLAAGSTFDLSCLRCAIVGGETVRESTLTNFERAFSHSGFQPLAFCPAYGLAEIGLAAAITRPADRWRSYHLDALAVAERRVVPAGTSTEGGGGVRLVASGNPIPGYEIRCDTTTDELGTIALRGPSIGVDTANGRSFADADGWLSTGDIGLMVDGWLYVSGRDDDHIVTYGRNIYAPAVENSVALVEGVRDGRVAAIGLPTGDWVVIVEPNAKRALSVSERRAIVGRVRRAAVDAAASSPSEVLITARGQLPMTASGKLQRRETLRRYTAREL